MPRKGPTPVANLVAATLLAATSPAAGQQYFDPARTDPAMVVYVACYVFTAGGDGTAIAVTPYRTTYRDWFNGFWENKLYKQIVPGTPYVSGRCTPFDALEKAEAWYVASGYRMVGRVDWPKEAPPAAEPPPPAPPKLAPAPGSRPFAGLIVKEDTSGKDAATAWEEQVKKGLSERAKKDIETAIRAAQEDAETKRKIAEFFAYRRHQGNAQ